MLFLFAVSCYKQNIDDKALRDFQQVNLVSNAAKYSPTVNDPTLQNAWGLSWSPTGIAWVNSLSGHVSELYTGGGAIVRAPVNIPSPGDTIGGLPTGVVFAGGAGFTLANKQPAAFLFVGIDGVVSGWNGAAGNNAFTIANNSANSSYTGLALATNNGSHYLYAANFGAGKIDVWDTTFSPVKMSFWDPAIPNGFAPFNIQLVGSWLFVTYAKVAANGHDQAGYGLGFVNIYNTDGSFIKRFASRNFLNAPWGVTQTPAGFLTTEDMSDETSHSTSNGKINMNNADQAFILIGNFGDGHINVFGLDGTYFGQLQNHNKRTIVIDGLWALSFAPATATTIDPNRLYFTARS